MLHLNTSRKTISLLAIALSVWFLCGHAAQAQTVSIAWSGPTGITGDANLYTNGTYVDALIPTATTVLKAKTPVQSRLMV